MLAYTDNGDEFTEYKVNLKDKFITDMQIAINDNKDIVCGGFYSDRGSFSIKGTYYLSVDNESGEIKDQNYKEFGIEFISQFMRGKTKAKKKQKAKKHKAKERELYNYYLDDIVLRADGGALLVAEQYYMRVHTYTTPGPNGSTTTRTTYTYYYNDIIVVNITPEGKIEWAKKIPKRQVTTNDGGFYSSYVMSLSEDKLYFVFNENIRNIKDVKPGKLYNFSRGKDGVVALVTMNSSGDFKKEILFKTKESNIITRPKVCKQLFNNELLIFGQRGKIQKFAKVTFE